MVETGQKEVSKGLVIKLAEKMEVSPASLMPFIFSDNNINIKKISKIERNLLSLGEKLQHYLVFVKAKKLKKYAIQK